MNHSLVAVMAALTIWLCTNTAKTNTVDDNSSANTALIAGMMDRLINLEEQCYKEELPIEVPEVKEDTINE